jgi:hypothetical protein
MLPLLRKTRVVNDPRHNLIVFLKGWQHLAPHLRQHLIVVPWGGRHQVMERLMHAPNIVGGQPRGHRFDTFALTRQQQSLAIVLQGSVSVGVPRGVGQALNICREAPLLWAWRREA